MTTLIESEIKAVKSDGIVWMIRGFELFKTDEEGSYFERFEAGVKFHMSVLNKLNGINPLPESERVEILKKIMNTVKELI